VLENPTEEIYRKELKKGYDDITFELKTLFVPAIATMVKIAREISPQSKIIVGGYGTLTLYNPVMKDPDNCATYLLENVDYICNGEGIGFMREILGSDINASISQKYLPKCGMTLQGFQNLFQFGSTAILVSLGCPNGCEFCFTSAYYKKQKITISSPEQCFNDLKIAYERTKDSGTLFNMVFDEDILQSREYMLKLGELIRNENFLDKINFFCFGSIGALSQYTAEELAQCGVGAIFIGVESSLEDVVTSEHNIQKRAGRDIKEIFDELHEYGIIIIGATILGWDFHTRENIQEDLNYFVNLKPDMYQLAPLSPCPGTKLYGRMLEQGRIYEKTWKDFQQNENDLFQYKNFDKNEIYKIYCKAHDQLYESNGPTLLNLADVMIKGYRTMLHSRDQHLQARADRCYFFAKKITPSMFHVLRKFAPSDAVHRRIDEVEKNYIQFIGKPTLNERFIGRFIITPLLSIERWERTRPNYECDPDELWRITHYPIDNSEPKVIARRDPFFYWRTEFQRKIVHKIIGLKQKNIHTIRLNEIDDFPVTFKTIEIEDNRMNYIDEGEGDILLMIHGNPTWSYLYRHFIKDLKSNYRCIAIDLLGYGLSDKPPNGDYRMEAHIRRLEKFVEKLNLKDITLICQDWGGIIGLSYAARNKERFSRLIPMNTTGFFPTKISEFLKCAKGAWVVPILLSFKIPWFGKKMAMNWNIFLKLATSIGINNRKRQMHKKAVAGYHYPFQRVEDRLAILKSVRQIPLLPRGHLWNLMKETERLLQDWNIRTQIIWGTKDAVFVPWFIDKFEKVLQNHAQTLRIPTANHFLQDDEPDIIIKKIREFLSEEIVEKKTKDIDAMVGTS